MIVSTRNTGMEHCSLRFLVNLVVKLSSMRARVLACAENELADGEDNLCRLQSAHAGLASRLSAA